MVKDRRDLFLVLGIRSGLIGLTNQLGAPLGSPGVQSTPRLAIPLRRGDELTLTESKRDALLSVVGASSIEIPGDKWDPKGKFARSGSPNHVTRDEALALIANPPSPGEPLPITGG